MCRLKVPSFIRHPRLNPLVCHFWTQRSWNSDNRWLHSTVTSPDSLLMSSFVNPVVISGPRCLVRCRDQMIAPAQAEGVQTSSSERRHLRRSEIWWPPRRKRPRSPVKLQPNSPRVPRGDALFIWKETIRETVLAWRPRKVYCIKKIDEMNKTARVRQNAKWFNLRKCNLGF